jgi:hypothetical protein
MFATNQPRGKTQDCPLLSSPLNGGMMSKTDGSAATAAHLLCLGRSSGVAAWLHSSLNQAANQRWLQGLSSTSSSRQGSRHCWLVGGAAEQQLQHRLHEHCLAASREWGACIKQ